MRRVAPEGFLHLPHNKHSLQMRLNNRTPMTAVLIAAAALVAAHLLDSIFYHYFSYPDIYSHDWGRALRVLGFLPLWWTAALALWLHDRATRGAWRAQLLAASPTLSGIAGEVLKLLLRRDRPSAHDGHYVFRSFADRPFHSGGLSLPSSHAIVAFGAAFILARLFPRARWVFYAAAAGCALSRVAAGAHFLSDVTFAAIAAWTVAWLLWRRFSPFSQKFPALP